MRPIVLLMVVIISGCAGQMVMPRPALEISKTKKFAPGYLAIIQGPTSEDAANINVMAPRLKNYHYQVKDASGRQYPVERYQTVHEPAVFYKVDNLLVTQLQPNTSYTLTVIDEFRDKKYEIDERIFKTLPLNKPEVRFVSLSCMADDYRFHEVIDAMWAKLLEVKPELIILNGDTVYVDSFEFVERDKATALDVWQRYIDSMKRLPLYHWHELVPILATWDDHDFGTNNGDRTFVSKESSLKIFRAFFGGKSLPGVWQTGPSGVSSRFYGFSQRFYFMDDRILRQPDKGQKAQEDFGHWGEKQHQWLIEDLKRDPRPAWIFNGNQVFSGKDLEYKEAFETNHPLHFRRFLNDLKQTPVSVIFSTGDIHFSEIMRIPAERLGYETFELTSSSMHSYTGEGWNNPARLPGMFTNEFNFMLIRAKNQQNGLNVFVQAIGRAPQPYFQTEITVKNRSVLQ
jgi:alkaline phosphatase D